MNAPSSLMSHSSSYHGRRVVEIDLKRRYQREVADCESTIHRAKLTLTHFVAEQFRLHREQIELERKLREYAITARWAYETGRRELAAELKGFIVEQYTALARFQGEYRQLEAHESGLSKNLRAAIAQVGSRSYGQHLSRAMSNVQRANRRLANHGRFVDQRLQHLANWMAGLRMAHDQFSESLLARVRCEERTEKVVAIKPPHDIA